MGAATARDQQILEWARQKGYVVFTHDLDFSTLLWQTRRCGPSVVQMRTQKITPDQMGLLVAATLSRHADALRAGALFTMDLVRSRVRLLPLSDPEDARDE